MATDTTNLPQGETRLDVASDMGASDLDPTSVQVAEAGGAEPVELPAGQRVVRIPVQPGQTIELPTDSADGLLAKFGAEGNLAIVVDGRTIILQGYVVANEQAPVKVVTDDGDTIDVADLIAATDPSLDIQTAAGPAAGAQAGTNGSGIYIPFGPGSGLGGIDAEGVLGATALRYRLIDNKTRLFDRDDDGSPQSIRIVPDEGRPLSLNSAFLLDEDDLASGTAGGPGDDAGTTTSSGTVIVDFGSDGPRDVDPIVMSGVVNGAPSGLFALDNGSFGPGAPILLQLDAPAGGFQVLHGYVGGTEYFTLTLDTATGHFVVEQLQPLWHPVGGTEDNVLLKVQFTAFDDNGDSISKSLTLSFDDDSPTIVPAAEEHSGRVSAIDGVNPATIAKVDEDALTDGIEGGPGDSAGIGASVTGTLGVNFGADGAGSIAFMENGQPSLTSQGEAVHYDWKANPDGTGVLYAYVGSNSADPSSWVFTVEVTSLENGGEYEFKLLRPLDHPDTNNNHADDATDDGAGAFEDNLIFNLKFKAKDGDGDPVTGKLRVNVDDDSPTITPVEDECEVPTARGDGQEGNPIHGVVLDEDNLPHGIEGGPGDDGYGTSVSGSLGVNFGADGAKSIVFSETGQPSLTSHGATVSYEWKGNPDGTGTLYAYVGSDPTDPNSWVFTVAVTSLANGGEYTVTLLKPLDHPDTNDDPSDDATDDGTSSFEDNLLLELEFKATDRDGDAATGHLKVNVDDDSPDACKVEISFGGACEDNKLVHDETHGKQDGGKYFPWDHDPDASRQDEDDICQQPEDFQQFEEKLCLDAVGYAKTQLNIDLSGGSSDPDAAFGADGPGSVSPVSIVNCFGGKFCGEKTNLTDTKTGCAIFLYTVQECGQTFVVGKVGGKDGPISFALHVSESGELEMAQYRAIQHPNGCDSDESLTLLDCHGKALIHLQVTVTDADGDTVTARQPVDGRHGNPSIVFQDDGPTVCATDCKLVLAMDESSGHGIWPYDQNQPGYSGIKDGHTPENDEILNYFKVLFSDLPNCPAPIGAAAGNVQKLFSVDFGTDEGCVVCYELTILNECTNLRDTETGTLITLTMDESGIVKGVDGCGNVVFAVWLDHDSGKIVSAQYRAIDHGDGEPAPGAHDEVKFLSDCTLGVTATAFDKDGDHDSKTVDISHGISFEDDGPKFCGVDFGCDDDSAHGVGQVDEDALPHGNYGGPGDDDGGRKTDGKVVFDFGNDKADRLEIRELTVKDASGKTVLVLCLDQNGCLKVVENCLFAIDNKALAFEQSGPDSHGVVTWTAYIAGCPGEKVFTFSLDTCGNSIGEFEFKLYQPLEHPFQDDGKGYNGTETKYEDNFKFDFTVRGYDGDGDSADGHVKVSIDDDSPVVECGEGSLKLAMDETVEFALFPNDKNFPEPNGDKDGSAFENDVIVRALDLIKAALHGLPILPLPIGAAADNVKDLFSVKFGADGGCEVCYDLTILCETTNLFDTESGTRITLCETPSGIVQGIDGCGNLVFAIWLDHESGDIVSAQYRAINHGGGEGAPGAHDEVKYLADGILGVTATATDNDGDKASKTVDISHGVSFDDDGPKFKEVDWGRGDSKNGVGLIDEDALPGGNAGGPGDDDGGKHADGKVVFDFGSDKPGRVEINALTVTDASGKTVLQLCLDQNGCLKVVENCLFAIDNKGLAFEQSGPDSNGVVTWTAYIAGCPGEKVFTFSLDTCGSNIGEFDFCLLQPLEHPLTDNPSQGGTQTAYEDNFKFDFTVRGYDGDGDSADGHVKLSVDDDSPVVECGEGSLKLAMDETDKFQLFPRDEDFPEPNGPQDGSAPEGDWLSNLATILNLIFPGPIPDVLGAAQDNVKDLFSVSFGADGGCEVCYDLTVLGNGVTNLIDTETGTCITLCKTPSGIVEGVDGCGNVVFAVWLDHESGEIVSVQFRAINHGGEEGAPGAFDEVKVLCEGILGVTATATDNDGDKTSKTVDIGNGIAFEDDGPKFKEVDWGNDHDSDRGTGEIDEDALPYGIQEGPGDDDGGKSADGKVVFDFGSDKAGKVEINALTVKDASGKTVLEVCLDQNGCPKIVENCLFAINDKAIDLRQEGPDSNGVVTWVAFIAGCPDEKVFTFSLDTKGQNIGEFDFCLLQPLEHPFQDDGKGYNGTETKYEDNFKFDFTVRGYDGDGDSADGHVKLSVDDDTPKVEACEGASLTLAMDETDDFQLIPHDDDRPEQDGPQDGPANEGDWLSNLAIIFDAIFPGNLPDVLGAAKDNVKDLFKVSFGADGGCTVCYELCVLGDGKTNLIDTESGQCITLVKDSSGIVKGMAGGELVFAVWLDQETGEIVSVQFRAINHGGEEGQPGAHDEIKALCEGVLGVTATATDNDGDKSSKTVDIGKGVSFEDDGPQVVILQKLGAEIRLDESLTPGAGEPSDPNAGDETASGDTTDIGYKTVAGSSLFNVLVEDYGADGAKSKAFSLTIGNANSGLIDVATGQPVVLSQDGNVVSGKVGDKVVFTITIDPTDGDVTVAQFHAVKHDKAGDPDEHGDWLPIGTDEPQTMNNGALSLTLTLTDKDHDSASSSIDLGKLIKFEDDGPFARNDSDSVTEDSAEDAVGNVFAAGNVAVIGGTPYSDTNTSDGVSDDAGTDGLKSIQWKEGNGFDADGQIQGVYGTLYVNADGGYRYVLDESKAALATLDNGEKLYENFEYVITDKDDDTSKAKLTITIDGHTDALPPIAQDAAAKVDEDGIPSIGNTQNHQTTGDDNADVAPDTATPDEHVWQATLPVNWQGFPGTITLTAGTWTGLLTIDGHAIETDPASTSTHLIARDAVTGETVFAVEILNATTGEYKVTLSKPLLHPDSNAAIDDAADFGKGSVEDNLNIPVNVAYTNEAGTVNKSLTIDVDDDSPTWSSVAWNSGIDDEGAPLPGYTGIEGAGVGFDHAGSVVTSTINSTFVGGADGLHSVAPALDEIVAANGSLRATDGTVDGAPIVFAFEGADVVARISDVSSPLNGQEVIRIHPEVTLGQFTVTLASPIFHVGQGEQNASLKVYLKAIDKDGDATVTPAISFNLNDDMPDAGVSTLPVSPIVLDESAAGTDLDGVNAAPAGRSSWTVNYAANFTGLNYGADGAAGTGAVAYALQLTGENVPSGLYALNASGTGQGDPIVLNQSGNTITGSASGVPYFTITVDPTDGDVTFTQLKNVWHGNTSSDDDTSTLSLATADLLKLVQTLTDGDGDTDSASINLGQGVFQIEDDGPVANDDTDSVTEGIIQPASGNVITGIDGVLGTDENGEDGEDGVIDNPGTDGLHSITWTGESGGKIEGTYGTLTVDANGNYRYDLNENDPDLDDLDTGEKGYETFSYTITDKDGDTSTATLKITVNGETENNLPVAQDDAKSLPESTTASYNIMLILDLSLSMGSASGNPTRLSIAQDALSDLIDQYANISGNVSFQLTTFANTGTLYPTTYSNSGAPGTSSLQALKNLINGFDQGDLVAETDYDDAIAAAQPGINAWQPAGGGLSNAVYFISDGQPQDGSGGDSDVTISDSEENTWKDLLAEKGAEAFAVGVDLGNGANTEHLEDVAFPADSAHVHLTASGDLSTLLVGTLPVVSTVTGNVLANDTHGGDNYASPPITQFVHDGHTYSLADGIGDEGGTVINKTGNTIVISTDKGGVLEFNFANGNYKYTAPTATADFTEDFAYTIKDSNGDSDDATLHITVQNQPEAPQATNDRIYTNISGAFTVQDAWLLKNDKDADTAHAALVIASAAAASGQGTFFENGTPSHAGTSTSIDLEIGGGSGAIGNGESTSFDYVVKDPVLQDAGNVSITYDTSGSINGSSQDDILIGNNVGLDGGAGNDQLVGTGSNDLLDYSNINTGWSLTLGAGGSGVATVDGTDAYEGIDGIIGGGGSDTLTGNELANILNGGAGNDTLTGGLGTDTLNGGDGDDVLMYDSQDTFNGDGGTDVLDVSGAGNVDFTAIADGRIDNVEIIRMTGGGNGTITLNASDVISDFEGGTLDPSGASYSAQEVIRIEGNAGDTVNLQSGAGDSWVVGSAGGVPAGFTLYVHVTSGSNPSSNEDAYVLIQNGITVNQN